MAISVDANLSREFDSRPTAVEGQKVWAAISVDSQSNLRPTQVVAAMPGGIPHDVLSPQPDSQSQSLDKTLRPGYQPSSQFLAEVDTYNSKEAAIHEYDPATKQKIDALNAKSDNNQPLTQDEKYELQAVNTFPHDGFSAFLDARALSGEQLNAADNRSLSEAKHFHTNYYCRNLEDRETTGTIKQPEEDVLNWYRFNRPDDHEPAPQPKPATKHNVSWA